MGAVEAQGRIAVVGGRGELGPLARLETRVETFGSPSEVGGGAVRRLEAALRAGTYEVVIVLARWGGHSTTTRLKTVCKSTRTRFLVWPGGLSSLAEALAN